MSGYQDSDRCQQCGGPSENHLEVAQSADPDAAAIVVASLCTKCFDEAVAGWHECRRQFEFLRANGVSRERANAIMIDRINKGLA